MKYLLLTALLVFSLGFATMASADLTQGYNSYAVDDPPLDLMPNLVQPLVDVKEASLLSRTSCPHGRDYHKTSTFAPMLAGTAFHLEDPGIRNS